MLDCKYKTLASALRIHAAIKGLQHHHSLSESLPINTIYSESPQWQTGPSSSAKSKMHCTELSKQRAKASPWRLMWGEDVDTEKPQQTEAQKKVGLGKCHKTHIYQMHTMSPHQQGAWILFFFLSKVEINGGCTLHLPQYSNTESDDPVPRREICMALPSEGTFSSTVFLQ